MNFTADRPTRFNAASVFIFSLVLAVVTGAPMRGAEPVVTVTGGAIRGRLLPEAHGAVFRGIPFAAPPVGDLRWREPQPVRAWSGVREADKPGAPAAQPPLGWNDPVAAASNEDCLYLDVWTPTLSATDRLPVMVWLHGGANIAGGGGFDPVYHGGPLITHGVILVVVEYRVGIFGFLAHPELTRESPHHSSGNYALLDQLAALRWVHDNIARFGGDPGNVTVFGQSAGSMDVIGLLSSPLSRGLIHRAIAQSGVPGRRSNATLGTLETKGVDLIHSLRVSKGSFTPQQAAGPDGLAYLRSLDTAELLKVTAGYSQFCIDGWVLPDSTIEVWRKGKELPVPLIIGGCAIEFPADGDGDRIRQSMQRELGAGAPQAFALYGVANGGSGAAVDSLYGDVAEQWGSDQFRCPAIIHGEWHRHAGHPVWEYQFDRAIPPHPKVGHSGDLPYVFGAFSLKAGNLVGNYGAKDRRLSAAMQRYWTNFAKTGNPNGDSVTAWPEFDGQQRRYLEFTADAAIVVAKNQRGPYCDLFRAALERSDAQPNP